MTSDEAREGAGREERVMCEYCESMKPINEVSDCGEGVGMRLIHNRDGSWVLDVTGYYDGGYICGGATVPIVACPMCGRKLAERGK